MAGLYVCHALYIKYKRIISYSFIVNDLLPDTFFNLHTFSLLSRLNILSVQLAYHGNPSE